MLTNKFSSDIKISFSAAKYDLISRFARTKLGPFWHTLALLLTILAMGAIYGSIVSNDTVAFTSELALSLAVWQSFSTHVIESTSIHRETKNFYSVLGFRPFLGLLRLSMRNYFYFLFSTISIAITYLILGLDFSISMLSIFIIYPLIVLFSFPLFYLLSIWSIKYPDISMIVNSIITLLFFISPIVWTPEMLPLDKFYFIEFNPIYYIMELSRSTFFGKEILIQTNTYLVVFYILITLVLVFSKKDKNLFFEL